MWNCLLPISAAKLNKRNKTSSQSPFWTLVETCAGPPIEDAPARVGGSACVHVLLAALSVSDGTPTESGENLVALLLAVAEPPTKAAPKEIAASAAGRIFVECCRCVLLFHHGGRNGGLQVIGGTGAVGNLHAIRLRQGHKDTIERLQVGLQAIRLQQRFNTPLKGSRMATPRR